MSLCRVPCVRVARFCSKLYTNSGGHAAARASSQGHVFVHSVGLRPFCVVTAVGVPSGYP
eukprot:2297000-Prymnesium_polylepis.1